MTEAWLAAAGWLVAVGAIACLALQIRSRQRSLDALLRACHELRGPITAARLAVELIGRDGRFSSDRLNAIDLELEHATLALSDLTALATRAESIATREEFDLQKLLVELAEAWAGAARARDARLEVLPRTTPATIFGERLRVGQAIGNLIANAIEHGGGLVRMQAASEGELARVEVSDDGPGLAAPIAELARRANKKRRTRGRGIAIAAAVAESHGGRLAASPSERGAKVVLELAAAGAGQLQQRVREDVGESDAHALLAGVRSRDG